VRAAKLSPVPAATTQRRLLFVTALLSYGVVFTCFVLFEIPGLGLGHFFYIPVALLALACGTSAGFFGGSLAAALYALAIVLTPRLPTRDVLTYASAVTSSRSSRTRRRRMHRTCAAGCATGSPRTTCT
jgi:Flp pilus assembly protein protease CpaA